MDSISKPNKILQSYVFNLQDHRFQATTQTKQKAILWLFAYQLLPLLLLISLAIFELWIKPAYQQKMLHQEQISYNQANKIYQQNLLQLKRKEPQILELIARTKNINPIIQPLLAIAELLPLNSNISLYEYNKNNLAKKAGIRVLGNMSDKHFNVFINSLKKDKRIKTLEIIIQKRNSGLTNIINYELLIHPVFLNIT